MMIRENFDVCRFAETAAVVINVTGVVVVAAAISGIQ